MSAAAVLSLLAGSVRAGTMQVTPTLNEVAARKPAATFTVVNPGADAMTVQVRIFNWSQTATGEDLVPSSDLLIVPPLFTVPGGGRQLVRIATRERPADHELAYRVHFQQIPDAPLPGQIGILTAVDFNVPLFFSAAQPQTAMEWHSAVKDAHHLRLTASNRGSRFTRLNSIKVRDGGRVLGQLGGPQYILAGSERTWDMVLEAEVQRGSRLTLILDSGAQPQEIPVTAD